MRLTGKEKAAYGIGAVGKDMVYMLTAGYVLYYFQDVMGISAIFTGMLLMVARVFDALNDPIMGVIVAKTKTRFGKFRPWLLIGTLINAVVLYLMFAIPEGLTGNALMAYAALSYIMWGTTYTMMDIPYWSMIPAFTADGKDRESLSTLGRTCAGVGSAIITVLTVKAVDILGGGDEREGFRLFALIVAVIFSLTAIIMCVCIKEKSTVDMETTSIGEMFKALFRNDQAVTVVIAIVLINCSIYLTSNLVIYFFKYDIGGADWQNAYTLFNTFGGGIQILSMMLFYPLLRKKLSTTNTFKFGLGAAVVGYIVLLGLACTGTKNIVLLLIPGFFIFAANGILTVLTTVFLANSVDYGQWKNGRREESVIFSMQTFVVQLASGISALLASICLAVFNISDNTEIDAVLSTQSVLGLRFTMSMVPVVGLVIAFFYFSKKFILTDEKVAEIADSLKGKES
ncbi:MAG: MFS transporter [Lachnospiraceae bacterium]|nr:MFS transporter [Lachnospiraceae bacterium]